VLLKHTDLLEQRTAAQALVDVSNGAGKTYYNVAFAISLSLLYRRTRTRSALREWATCLSMLDARVG
jgi:hypothetical protein